MSLFEARQRLVSLLRKIKNQKQTQAMRDKSYQSYLKTRERHEREKHEVNPFKALVKVKRKMRGI